MNLTTTLYPSYQLPIYNDIPVQLAQHKYIIVQSPAGSGKSVIMSHTVARIIRGGRIPLVLTHRTQIQSQLMYHCQGVSIDSDTDHVFIQPNNCYVAMHQTLIKRINIIEQFAKLCNKIVIIIDECHYGIFNKLLDLLPDAFRIGFTATPAWKWAKHLNKYYNHLIHGPQISTLILEGNLIPFEYHEMQVNLDGLQTKSTGDYTEQSQFDVFNRTTLFNGLIEQLQAWEGRYKKGVIFCSSIKQCDTVHSTINEAGFNAVKYHSTMKDGAYQKARFTELNESNLIVSVSSLAEGWDFPPIDFGILYRATTSLPLYIQMGMRSSRKSPGKTKAVILDFGGNNTRFGGSSTLCSMTMDRDWNELWQPPKKITKAGSGVAGIKLCEKCQYMLSALAKSCCNCGYIYPEIERALIDGELVRIQEQQQAEAATLQSTSGRLLSTLTAEELALWAKKNDKRAWAVRVAKSRTVTDVTYAYAYEAAIGYKKSWADRVVQDIALQQSYEPDMKIEFKDIIV